MSTYTITLSASKKSSECYTIAKNLISLANMIIIKSEERFIIAKEERKKDNIYPIFIEIIFKDLGINKTEILINSEVMGNSLLVTKYLVAKVNNFGRYLDLSITQENNNFVTCPYCREEINYNAIKCKHCNENLEDKKNDLIQQYNKLSMKQKILIPNDFNNFLNKQSRNEFILQLIIGGIVGLVIFFIYLEYDKNNKELEKLNTQQERLNSDLKRELNTLDFYSRQH